MIINYSHSPSLAALGSYANQYCAVSPILVAEWETDAWKLPLEGKQKLLFVVAAAEIPSVVFSSLSVSSEVFCPSPE